MTARALIRNIEPKGGESLTVQVDGEAPDLLLPGEEITVSVDADNELIVSVENEQTSVMRSCM